MESLLGRALFACASLAWASVSLASAQAGQNFHGPVKANVLDVIDGDTFLADALVWPGQSIRINVRIRGIDAPEMKSRCAGEHEAALRAREALSALIADATVSISNIGGAKYYGRVLADVKTPQGVAVADKMLGQSLVHPYDGGRRKSWCN
jgi:endonuclease YncB( thermonuclease family)